MRSIMKRITIEELIRSHYDGSLYKDKCDRKIIHDAGYTSWFIEDHNMVKHIKKLVPKIKKLWRVSFMRDIYLSIELSQARYNRYVFCIKCYLDSTDELEFRISSSRCAIFLNHKLLIRFKKWKHLYEFWRKVYTIQHLINLTQEHKLGYNGLYIKEDICI